MIVFNSRINQISFCKLSDVKFTDQFQVTGAAQTCPPVICMPATIITTMLGCPTVQSSSISDHSNSGNRIESLSCHSRPALNPLGFRSRSTSNDFNRVCGVVPSNGESRPISNDLKDIRDIVYLGHGHLRRQVISKRLNGRNRIRKHPLAARLRKPIGYSRFRPKDFRQLSERRWWIDSSAERWQRHQLLWRPTFHGWWSTSLPPLMLIASDDAGYVTVTSSPNHHVNSGSSGIETATWPESSSPTPIDSGNHAVCN